MLFSSSPLPHLPHHCYTRGNWGQISDPLLPPKFPQGAMRPGSEWIKCWENSVHSLYEGKGQDVVSMNVLETQYGRVSSFIGSQNKQKVSHWVSEKNSTSSIKRCIMSKQGDIPEYLEELIKWSRYTVKTKWNNIKTTQQN